MTTQISTAQLAAMLQDTRIRTLELVDDLNAIIARFNDPKSVALADGSYVYFRGCSV